MALMPTLNAKCHTRHPMPKNARLARQPPTRGFHDECLKGDAQFSLGFMKPCLVWPFGSTSAFWSPGAGGALGFADPSAGIGYANVTSQMGTSLKGDPRDVTLGDALSAAGLTTETMHEYCEPVRNSHV
jgi:hypothetical protein